MNFKPAKPASVDQFAKSGSRSGGCGCVGVGCLACVVGMVVLCVGSYFVMMHTQVPLALIESAIESSGDVRVEGLSGSISSGFEIDQLEFRSEDRRNWNELRGVKFAFNGIFDLMRHNRLIIEEASISGATIYARFDDADSLDEADPDFDWDVDGDDVAEEVNEELDELRRELESEDWGDLEEVRIDLVKASDIEIVNPETDARLNFEKVEFRNFQMFSGEIRSLGDIDVVSDQLDLVTGKSTVYPDQPIAWQLTGTAKTPVHKSLTADIPFVFDLAIAKGNKLRVTASLCDDALRISEPYGDTMTIQLTDFTPSHFVELTTGLAPAHWTGSLVFESETSPVDVASDSDEEEPSKDDESTDNETGNDEPAGDDPESKTPEQRQAKDRASRKRVSNLTVSPGTTFELGETQFDIEPTTIVFDRDSDPPATLTAEGSWNDKTISAELSLMGKLPWVRVHLSADGMEETDIWAGLFFGKRYAELETQEQQEIDEVMNPATTDLPEPVEF